MVVQLLSRLGWLVISLVVASVLVFSVVNVLPGDVAAVMLGTNATPEAIECEFVCIPRPSERTSVADGGPLSYRVVHRAPLWKRQERPRLEQRVLEGNPVLSL